MKKKSNQSSKAKTKLTTEQKIARSEKLYELFLILAIAALFAFSFCIGLGANFYASLALAIVSALCFATAAIFGYFARFKKNWDKDQTSSKDYFEGVETHQEDNNKKDED